MHLVLSLVQSLWGAACVLRMFAGRHLGLRSCRLPTCTAFVGCCLCITTIIRMFQVCQRAGVPVGRCVCINSIIRMFLGLGLMPTCKVLVGRCMRHSHVFWAESRLECVCIATMNYYSHASAGLKLFKLPTCKVLVGCRVCITSMIRMFAGWHLAASQA